MAVTDTINSMKTNLRNAYNSLSDKGATIPFKKNLANLKSTIDTIQTGESSHPTYCFVVDQWYSTNSKYPKVVTAYGGTAIDHGLFGNPTENYGTWIRLTKATTPETTTTIGHYAFRYCKALVEVNLPDIITTINTYAFYGCVKLELDKLPSSLKTLGNYAFQNCSLITIKEIPSGVTTIGTYVFRNCTSLTELTIKGAITSIGNYAFSGCTALKKLSFPNLTKVPTLSNTSAIPTTIETIEVPSSLIDSIKAGTNWSSFADKIVGI